MTTNCEHYRVKTGSCGLLDKDDHTYSCDKLMLNDECPMMTSNDKRTETTAN